MDFINRIYVPLRDLYRSMTPASRRTAVLMMVVIGLSLGYLLAHPISGPDVDLMHGSPLTASQLQAMEAAFGKANLKGYEIRGNSIFVPRGQEATYMAALHDNKALPTSFNDALRQAAESGNIFEDHRLREQRMKIALQDELALNIRRMLGIESASVLFDVDNNRGFGKEKIVTAAATVKPVGSTQLDEGRVSAIRHLLVRAIAGLKPENVSVIDLNGRTWSGNLDESGAENVYISLQRYEHDLKAKILGSLSFIPNVAVEASVELDHAAYAKDLTKKDLVGLAPVTARVSVGVPVSYFRKVWQERHPVVADQPPQSPDTAALEKIREEQVAEIRKCVVPLLPSVAGAASPLEAVTVTPFQDIRTPEPLPPSLVDFLWAWLAQSWNTVGLVGVALICLFVLRSMLRSGRSSADMSADTASAQNGIDKERLKPGTIPAPHWARRHPAVAQPLREELSRLVEANPKAAASVLRKWIAEVN